MTMPAEDPATARMRARQRVMAARAADIRRAQLAREEREMPFDPNRPQSGMFDSHGDGHPTREAYMPAHGVCAPVDEPEQEPAPEPSPEAAPAL